MDEKVTAAVYNECVVNIVLERAIADECTSSGLHDYKWLLITDAVCWIDRVVILVRSD